MTVTEFINQTYLFATGKGTGLDSTNPKYQKILMLGNAYQLQWAKEPGVKWSSLRTVFELGTVTATDTFDLDPDIGTISEQEGDYVRIRHANGVQESDYTLVPIDRLYNWGSTINNRSDNCAVSGTSLVFSTAFKTTDPQFGGSILVPGTATPSKLVRTNDVIAVDSPIWLVYICAAEYVRTDITLANQYPNLVSLANSVMSEMKDNNESQDETVTTPWSPMGVTW